MNARPSLGSLMTVPPLPHPCTRNPRPGQRVYPHSRYPPASAAKRAGGGYSSTDTSVSEGGARMNRTASITLLTSALAVTISPAQVIRPVLSSPREFVASVTIDDAGGAVYAVPTTNQFGTNPKHRKQIVRWNPATGVGTPITDFEEGVETVSVSDDGDWLAFVSSADPVGTNHDESPEVFVMHPDGTGLAQLTSQSLLPVGKRGVHSAVISGSGNRIVFAGRIDPLGTNPAYTTALFVVDRDGTNLRQLALDVLGPGFDVSDDGNNVVYIRNEAP